MAIERSFSLLLLRLLGRLPLGVLQRLGALLGWGVYLASPRYRARLRDNLAASGVCEDRAAFRRCLRANIAHTGKSVIELAAVWTRQPKAVYQLTRELQGWSHLVAAQAAGKGMILLTPHLGNYEVVAGYISAHYPLTGLYRPSKQAWVERLIQVGRGREAVKLAPADSGGVRQLLSALRRNEGVVILPDQVPGVGEGVWADFFGRPAYTMSLVPRLAEKTGAAVLLFYGERLAHGAGFALHCTPLTVPFTGDKITDANIVNAAICNVIRTLPEQYLWSYNRYKTPKNASTPVTADPN